MDFTQIPATLNYPKKHKAALSQLHSDIITNFPKLYQVNYTNKRKIIDVLNYVSYFALSGDAFPDGWESCRPLDVQVDQYFENIELEDYLKDLFIIYKDVVWDIDGSSPEVLDTQKSTAQTAAPLTAKPIEKLAAKPDIHITVSHGSDVSIIDKVDVKTPIDDVLLEPRKVPRFDYSKPWMKQTVNGTTYTIPTSLPLKPERSQDITVTTDVNLMSDYDTDRLFPNWFMHTRGVSLYRPLDGVELDPDFGLIFRFDGFTREQVLDNIIKYPYLYNVTRLVNGEIKDFYLDIEIDGELQSTESIWNSMNDTKILPKTKRFMTEYVVRRYLLERDVNGVEHKYPIRGSYDPFLVLFMPKEMYIQHGYTNVGRLHVQSRVSYLQMLNPILGSIYFTGNGYCVPDCPFSDQCTDPFCDRSCVKYNEFMHLFSTINSYDLRSPVFQTSDALISQAQSVLRSEEKLIVIESAKTVDSSNLITYLACCDKWKNNGCNCTVYNLNFSKYIESTRKSWSMTIDSFEYEKRWIEYTPLLIISNLDYVQFRDKDFEAQTLLNLIRSNEIAGKKTIIVSPKIDSLIGKGQAFEQLKKKLKEAVIRL